MFVSRPARPSAFGLATAHLALVLLVFASRGQAQQTLAPPPPPEYTQPVVITGSPFPGSFAQPRVGATLPAPPPQPQPVEIVRSESIRALWLPGVIVLPIAWITTWTAASSSLHGDAVTFSWIPLLGPWLMLGEDVNGYEGYVILSGVVQAVATLAIVLGVTLRRTWTETVYKHAPPPTWPARRISFNLRPLPAGVALGVRLAF